MRCLNLSYQSNRRYQGSALLKRYDRKLPILKRNLQPEGLFEANTSHPILLIGNTDVYSYFSPVELMSEKSRSVIATADALNWGATSRAIEKSKFLGIIEATGIKRIDLFEGSDSGSVRNLRARCRVHSLFG